MKIEFASVSCDHTFSHSFRKYSNWHRFFADLFYLFRLLVSIVRGTDNTIANRSCAFFSFFCFWANVTSKQSMNRHLIYFCFCAFDFLLLAIYFVGEYVSSWQRRDCVILNKTFSDPVIICNCLPSLPPTKTMTNSRWFSCVNYLNRFYFVFFFLFCGAGRIND